VLTSLAGFRDCLFIVMPDTPELRPTAASTRAAQLKIHLQRIAAEVAASGVLTEYGPEPQLASLSQLQPLSARQWEILARLLRGERVPTIAKALYISQSTVRNHLAGIFSRFGVHSQPELLEVIRSTSEVSS
jgi:DNA-binding NarL/FixJ family response regulator